MTNPVRIVCFDLGGVLVRICDTWVGARAAAGLAARGEPFDPAVEEERRKLTTLLDIGRITVEEWAAGVSQVLGGTRLVHHDGSAPLTGDPEYPSVARLKRPFASHLLGLAKPNDAIYAEFERLTGLRGPEILFFDDRMENVEAALLRGWRAHRIDPRGDTIAQVREYLGRYEVLGSRSSPSTYP